MPTPITPQAGLDGLTILRVSHAFDSGGGLEQCLTDVNTVLSARNRIHTVEIRLAEKETAKKTVQIGHSQITTYYVPADKYAPTIDPIKPSLAARFIQVSLNWLRDNIIYQPLIHRTLTRWILRNRAAPRGICDPVLMLNAVRQAIIENPVDVAVMHSMGNEDCMEALKELRKNRIPTAIINYFSNDRFLNSAVREQVELADAIAGIGQRELPGYLRSRFFYAGDGIDTDFFQRSKASPVGNEFPSPRVLLPARIVPTKGHLDLVRAAGILRRAGKPMHLYFAGRSDSSEYLDRIRAEASAEGIPEQIHFLGCLDRSELRNWYAASIATAFPTSHHEGLGRITLESQAMETPPVAYDIGGVREGFVAEKTGLLIRLGDVAALAHALGRLAADEAERLAMGLGGRDFVRRHFSFSALAERHEQLLLTLAVKRRRINPPSATLPSPCAS